MTPSTNAYPAREVSGPVRETGPLTFTAPSGADGQLADASGTVVPDSAWHDLAGCVAAEPTLTPFPARVLRDRWESGNAALVLDDGAIAAYISCAPVLDAVTRSMLREVWAGDPPSADREFPVINVYESLTGWTAPALRRNGISLALRRQLLARIEGPDTLFVGFTAGTGASPVLSKLGWQVLPWRDISFVGSLIENSAIDCSHGVLDGWRVDGLKPYDGEGPLTFSADHDWRSCCHFWMSRPALACDLNATLGRLNAGDLCLWRERWGHVMERVLLDRGWVPIVLGE
jgi:hypothetical protein